MFKRNLAVLITVPFVFVACSGGGGGSSAAGNNSVFGQNISAQFIDAPVKGLKFTTESGVSSNTGDGGKFTCKRGETVHFSLGNFELGYAACGSQIFIHDMASSAAGYSWQKAASLIQSFSADNNGVLDLSDVDHGTLDLNSDISYSSGSFDADVGTALAAAAPSRSHVNVAAATSAANTSLGEHLSLSSQLSYVLEQLAASSSPLKLKGKLVKQVYLPDGEAWCWENIEATSSVTSADDIYKFNIASAVSWDDDSVMANPGVCASGEESSEECENSLSSDLPGEKIITGSLLDLNYFVERSSAELGGIQVRMTNTISLNTVVGTGSVTVKGVFVNKTKALTGAYAGTELECKYNVSSSSNVSTSYEAQKPTAGTYAGDVTCDDSSSTQKALSLAVSSNLSAALSVDSTPVAGSYTFKQVVEDAFKKYYEIEVGTEGQAGYLSVSVVDEDSLHVTTQATVNSDLVTCMGEISL